MAGFCDVLIVAEQSSGELKRSAIELATKARQLAGAAGSTVSAVVVGPGAASAAAMLADYGVGRGFVSEDDRFDRFPILGEVAAVEDAVRLAGPRVVLLASTNSGRDLAGRLSARLGIGAIAGAIDVRLNGEALEVVCPIFGGTVNAVKTLAGKTGVVLLRPNSVLAETVSPPAAISVERIDARFADGAAAEVVESVHEVRRAAPVEEAGVIVAGGRGLGGPEGFTLLQELADALGGSVGATRAAVDAGWIAYETQIGQTGKTVKPRLYVALGVSGAVQHRVGMQTSDVIVAVNKNADAAIFQLADLGVVGDLFEIAPKLAAEIRRRKS